MVQEHALVRDAAEEKTGKVLAAVVVVAQFKAEARFAVGAFKGTAPAGGFIREHHQIAAVSLRDGRLRGTQLVQVDDQINLGRAHRLSGNGVQQFAGRQLPPELIGPGLVLLLGVQGHHDEAVPIDFAAGVHLVYHLCHLQQSGHARGVGIGPGIEPAVEGAQVVKMRHQNHIAGGRGAAGDEAHHIAGQPVVGAETV